MMGLWEAEGWGWGSEGEWNSKYFSRTDVRPIVVVAEDCEGRLAAQLELRPTPLRLGARPARAVRLSAVLLRDDLRQASVLTEDHPVIRLFRFGIESAARSGHELMYAFPNAYWMHFLEWTRRRGLGRFHFSRHHGVRRTLSNELPAAVRTRGLEVQPVTRFDREYGALWAAARRSFPVRCGVARSPEWLRTRLADWLDLLTLDARDPDTSALIGYVSLRRRDGLLTDVIARDPTDLDRVIGAAIGWLTAHPTAVSPNVEALKAMRTPQLSEPLSRLGFVGDDFDFAFACLALRSDISEEAVTAEAWYLTPEE